MTTIKVPDMMCENCVKRITNALTAAELKFSVSLDTKTVTIDGCDNCVKTAVSELEDLGFGSLPVCVAKTQYSLSDDAKKLGAPKDFTLTVRALRISAGAGFVVALAGNIMTMPGLPRHPAAENIDIAGDGRITGLF